MLSKHGREVRNQPLVPRRHVSICLHRYRYSLTRSASYDSLGIFSAPRALFTFKALGHINSSVLDGGLPRWEAEGLKIESGTLAEVDKTSYPPPPLNHSVIRSASSYALFLTESNRI